MFMRNYHNKESKVKNFKYLKRTFRGNNLILKTLKSCPSREAILVKHMWRIHLDHEELLPLSWQQNIRKCHKSSLLACTFKIKKIWSSFLNNDIAREQFLNGRQLYILQNFRTFAWPGIKDKIYIFSLIPWKVLVWLFWVYRNNRMHALAQCV
jgi:hypothetical protein